MASEISGRKLSPVVLVLFLFAFGGVLSASPLFYSVGPDNAAVPRNFNSIPSGGPGPTSLFNLSDGSLGFDGGLTYRPNDGRFYAVANDGSGNSTLESFTLGGAATLTPVFSLGTGFLSGLAFDSADGNLYAIADDSISGHSFLDRLNLGSSTVTQVLDLGLGFEGGGLFNGGLTFDPVNGKLYALGSDNNNGVTRPLYEIDLGASAVTFKFSLGDGSLSFNGGLLFHPDNGLFYVISNDANANSELNSFSLGGGAGSLTPLFSLGQGFNNVGLTEIPSIPEPSTGILFATAAAALIALRRLRGRRANGRAII
jgi:hypothetical protein